MVSRRRLRFLLQSIASQDEPASHGAAAASSHQDNLGPEWYQHVSRLLVAGFVLIIVLIGVDGVAGFRSILSIRENVSTMTETQFRNVVLIDGVQRAEASLGALYYRLSSDYHREERAQISERVVAIEKTLGELFAQVSPADPDLAVWSDVRDSATEVIAEVRRLLELQPGATLDPSPLIQKRARLSSATAHLIRSNHNRAEITRVEIERIAKRQLIEDAILLGAVLLLACICAWVVLRSAKRLYSRMNRQTEELNRVSWQLLEKQESLSRRLSHELHDELGQSLTALKTNFTRHAKAGFADSNWVQDCGDLLRDSIRNVHEMSLLLRPTILDDFGLNSAVDWLCERFEERNQVEVISRIDFQGRLDSQSETHVFRIAQEALTNIARHAKSTRVIVRLKRESEVGILRVSDDGVGFSPHTLTHQFGLTGMQARARSLRGNLQITSIPGQGTDLVLTFPLVVAPTR